MTNENTYRWGYTFLQTDTRIEASARFELLCYATEMYLSKESTRIIDRENFGGTLAMKGYATLGTFGGVQFDAKISTATGKATLSFLVSEQTGIGQGNLEKDKVWN